MKPILVHVHIYYTNMWPELRDCIKNLEPYPYDIYVTLLSEAESMKSTILADFPTAKIVVVENRGYDIGPFLSVLELVDLNQYSYLLKLHTKRDLKEPLNFRGFTGPHWRNRLLSFVRNKRRVRKCIQIFEQEPKTGMLTNCHLIERDDVTDPFSARATRAFLKEKKLPNLDFSFVAGAMFFCRAALLQPLKDFHFKMSDFDVPTASRKHNLAHVIERLFGYFVYNQGYIIRDPFISKRIQQRLARYYRVIEVFKPRHYKRKITNRGFLLIKLFGIPIVHKRLSPEELEKAKK